ncbi:MAG: deoxyribose-phosphate aldolase [Pyrinomonadaceae bacterium]|nr:deoxyribose-phosphate aldolase [Pyrinomonadaceae bacterium]
MTNAKDTAKIARMIDHTLLKPEATRAQIEKLCAEAVQYDFVSVCVNPYWVATAKGFLKDSQVKVCTVIGFPLGANTTETKVYETQNAIENGACEIDMVINIGALKSGELEYVENDIIKIVQTSHENDAIVKVIIETALLTDDEKVSACQIAANAGADFVKTSTGFSTGGANIEDVKLMRETVGAIIGVKASGGIKTLDDALKMIDAGANRLGTSGGVKIVSEI